MKMETLKDLYVDNLKDLLNAEKQLVKALPKMAARASNPQLKTAFEEHLQQTKEHATRLEQALQMCNAGDSTKRCKAMEGLIEEGSEMLNMEGDKDVIDAGLIVAAQKAEHYEIASYGSVCTFAETLGYKDALPLLQRTIQEEKQTDERLTALAERGINKMATNNR
jgi:ferritin-like metal-binding protein YciE